MKSYLQQSKCDLLTPTLHPKRITGKNELTTIGHKNIKFDCIWLEGHFD